MTENKKILVINGPNLDKLGVREPEIYGKETLEDINSKVIAKGKEYGVEIECFQSNHEGEIIDKIGGTDAGSIIINPAGFTHTSVAIRDSLQAFEGKVVEVHLSNIFSREEFRRVSITASAATGLIGGFGSNSYILAIEALISV